ncbi:hypothetical protein KFK09_020200 [Dendrobium nobile]|uniref:RNase H type-1 domain-containing protein n=1 Tax=Dendrobium nobile TaxID=94219 RepID=A0A8T3AT53_DENNO|nr:hypothetical protein KFK09_020200 [Dendrobium nobile]
MVEDIERIIVKCSKLRDVFNHLNRWGFSISKCNSFSDCIFWLSVQNGWLNNLHCNAVYYNWKDRNNFVHNGMETSAVFIALEAISMAAISFSNAVDISGKWGVNQLGKLLDVHWHPPPPGWIKFNFDASLLQSYKGGIGGICRDSKDRFLLAFGYPITHWDVSKLEMLVAISFQNVLKDDMMKYDGIIIEGDNANVIKALQDNMVHKIDDLRGMFKDYRNIIFNCIDRKCNKLADLCANYAIVSSFIWDDLVLNKVSLSDLVGKNIVFYFFAHCCPPCRAFLLHIIEVYNKIKEKDDALEIIFISNDEDEVEDYMGT